MMAKLAKEITTLTQRPYFDGNRINTKIGL